ncbi:signal transduction histidine kinase [Pseudonocardia hierapolitana]|uniref:histidine kinase n=1 Tax=Pseudonocardia hierapolitana TaxID=1128676 RepID=A0A561T2T3_9PSEU|nr:ATP-binding protein [Pseudonocardia hierapolitana]TWF81422.1 signal transduction histidine kinase [Pseudonocardia hierapolitana]
MRRSVCRSVVNLIPHGYGLAEADWQRRHRLLLVVLAVHVPGLAAFGLFLRRPPDAVLIAVAVPAACLLVGWLLRRHRRVASVAVTAGLVWSSAALVGLTDGTIEAHFHFFVIIGFIALYQDWVPFLTNVLFTVVSHGVGSAWQQSLIFNHEPAQANPWLWSLIHGVAVLVACLGMALFWRVTEDSQQEKDALAQRLADAEINRRQFASDLLVNLARRNQSMLYRQLEIINQLETAEQDPDALAELFKLDHLATRVQRNAESLLVLAGEEPARIWREPVALRDVVRAAIAETEDFERVSVLIDDRLAIAGHSVTDLTHLIAELTENAVRFSPPDTLVRIRMRPDREHPGGELLVIEDWGVGMPAEDLAAANAILAKAVEVDLSVAQRLGFHVVARLSARHGIRVTLSPTPASGTTAVVALPVELFEGDADPFGLGREPVAIAGGTVPSTIGTAVLARPQRGGGAHRLRFDGDDTRPGRWGPHEAAPEPAVPAQRSEPAWFGDDAGQYIGLRRRVPQTHIVPELRSVGSAGAERPALPPAHVTGAAQALSRFHAGRRAAVEQGEEAPPEGAGTAWFEPAPSAPAPSDARPEPGTGR